MTRKIDYLFLPRDSKFWHVKLQSPDKRIERSLHTTDKAQAEVIALPMIAAHKAKLLARRPRLTETWTHKLEPGREHVAADGSRIIATEGELIHINPNGTTRTEPNGGPALRFSGFTGSPLTVQNMTRDLREAFDEHEGVRPTVATKNADDHLIEAYLDHGGRRGRSITGYPLKEARETWALFRELCPGVKLANATRDHGRALVAQLEARGIKSATIQHKVARLTAAVNFAIKEGKLTFNPFSGVVAKPKEGEPGASERRLPFDDTDMKVIRANLDKLTPADRLMVTILATTGMRLGEAFQITSEAKERGVRYVIVGSKTEQSLRRVPLPAKLLPLLPQAVRGPLFPDDDGHCASSRLNRFLRKTCGITDPRKVIHSFRHRAQDRLRAAECPQDIREAILGHEKKTVAAGYGEGFAVPVLKRWIDKIGF